MSPTERPPMPPPGPDDCDLDIDLDPDETAGGATYLGDYESIDAYLRAMLEPEIHPGIAWILDCLDMPRVRARFESDGSRLKLADGKVFNIG